MVDNRFTKRVFFLGGGRGTIFQGFGVLKLKVFTLYFNFEFITLTLNIKEMVVLVFELLRLNG